MNRIKIAKEILRLARELVSIEFPSEEAKKQYQREHDVRPSTNLTVTEMQDQHRRVQKDWEDTARELYRSKEPGVRGLTTLSSHIWDIDKIDWEATKREMKKLPSGAKLIRQMESLPKFQELAAGKYRELEKGMDKGEFKDLVTKWERFGDHDFRQIEDELVDSRNLKKSKA